MKYEIINNLGCSSVNTKQSYCCRDSHIRTKIFKEVLDGFDQLFLLLYLQVIVNWRRLVFEYLKRDVQNFYDLFWRLDSKTVGHRNSFYVDNHLKIFPAANYMSKINNRNSRTKRILLESGDKPEIHVKMGAERGGVATFFTTLQFSSIAFTFSDLQSLS